MRIVSERFAGQCVWMGTALVQFGPDGVAQGVIQRGLTTVDEPLDSDVFKQAEGLPQFFTVEDYVPGDAPEAPEPVEEEPVDDLDDLKRRDLLEIAGEVGLHDYVRMTNAELKAAIRKARG